MPPRTRAVILLSGGIDSTTTLAIARQRKVRVHALSIDYGQRHRCELEAAARVAACHDVEEHRVLEIDTSLFHGTALTGSLPVPRDRSDDDIKSGIPATYVPARNTVFLSLALAWAESLGAGSIHIGVTAVDYSGYPDCRPEYIEAFSRMAALATRTGVEGSPVTIETPLITLGKGEIIQLGMSAGADFALTSSCYDPGPGGTPCLHCDSCRIRARGFEDAGIPDPLLGVPAAGDTALEH